MMAPMATAASSAHGGICLYITPAAGSPTLYADPVDGGWLFIDGEMRQFPSWLGSHYGLSVSAVGCAPSTIYYVYAYWSGWSIALELSTTGHVTSLAAPFPGLEIKTNDATRTLVGMVYVHPDGLLRSSHACGTLLNWFHQKPLFLAGVGDTIPVSAVAPAWQEIAAPALNKIHLLAWGPKLNRLPIIHMGISGSGNVAAAGGRMDVVFGVTAYGPDVPVSSWMTVTSEKPGAYHNLSGASTMSFPEGLHEMNVWARVNTPGHVGSVSVNSFASLYG